jgi:Na+/melibiose symporter-like transporter
LSLRKKILYALGQFGLVLCAYGAGKLFVSFYVTRGFYGDAVFPSYIPERFIFGLFTVSGIILAVCRLVDAFAGVWFGYKSDASTNKKGRRTGLMVSAALPLALFSVLVFFPPSASSHSINAIFVMLFEVAFYVFLAMYSVPYIALLAEIGETPRDRVVISTMMAFATGLASLFGNRIFWLSDFLNANTGLSPVWVFRLIIALYALVAFVCMIIPARYINEKTVGPDLPVKGTLGESVSAVFRDSYFRHYFFADLMYRVASALTVAGFSSYAILLLGLTARDAAFFMLLIFFVGILLYVPVCLLVRRYGKRKLLFTAFLMLMGFLVVAAFAGRYPISPYFQGLVFSLLVAIPVAVFTVVPNALVADLAVVSERKTGDQRAGLYFGLYGLSEKASQMIVVIVFPLIVALGGEASKIGLRVTLAIAAVLSLTGFLFLFGYREKEVSAVLDRQ